MRTISLRLDEDIDATLRSLCERLDTTQTEVIRRALLLLAESATPTPASLAVELGLVGAFTSGDRDRAAEHSERIREALAARREGDERGVVEDAPRAAATSASSKRSHRRPDSKR